jgi:hypothetical protein
MKAGPNTKATVTETGTSPQAHRGTAPCSLIPSGVKKEPIEDKSMTLLSDDGGFIREITAERVQGLKDLYLLMFTSRFLASKNPDERQVNFKLTMSRSSLEKLKAEIDGAFNEPTKVAT